MSFRDNLIHLRAANNMTQEQLAVLLGVSRQAVTKWESEKSYPEMDKLLNQFHARFFRKLTKQTITKNQFKGVLFDTPLFFHPFGKQEKRAFLTNF